MEKEFPGYGYFKGSVTRVNNKRGLIQVTYEDGDQEELNERGLLKVLLEEQEEKDADAISSVTTVVPPMAPPLAIIPPIEVD